MPGVSAIAFICVLVCRIMPDSGPLRAVNFQGNPMIEIPAERLSIELLHAIAEEFVLREGTDYGDSEIALERKITQVVAQVKKGDICIAFDEGTESCNLVTREAWRKAQSQ